MASTKISAFTDGSTAAATDRIAAARSPFGSGDNRYLTPAYIKDYILGLANTWASGQIFVAPVLGTPASGTLTNCTGLPTVVVANEASDTTCFPLFATAATGELGPKTNTGLAFNSSTQALTLGGLLTVTQATANAGVLVSTGYSLTGSNATSMLDFAGTLNTSGSPDVVALRITDTARGANTKWVNIYGGASGTTTLWNVDRSGNTVQTGYVKATSIFSGNGNSLYLGNNEATFGGILRLQSSPGLTIVSTLSYLWSSDGTSFSSPDTGLSRNAAGIVEVNNGTPGTLRDLKARKLCTPMTGELTIATGAVTITGGYHRVDTEADAASDDLDTISGGADGDILTLRAENDARTVVVKDGTGNIQIAGDMTLDNTQDTITLRYDVTLTSWLEIGRAASGA